MYLIQINSIHLPWKKLRWFQSLSGRKEAKTYIGLDCFCALPHGLICLISHSLINQVRQKKTCFYKIYQVWSHGVINLAFDFIPWKKSLSWEGREFFIIKFRSTYSMKCVFFNCISLWNVSLFSIKYWILQIYNVILYINLVM